jgi:hypothetical protein
MVYGCYTTTSCYGQCPNGTYFNGSQCINCSYAISRCIRCLSASYCYQC